MLAKTLEYRFVESYRAEGLSDLLPQTRGSVAKSCTFSCCVDVLLKAARIPHRVVAVDVVNKPKMFLNLFPKGTTPGCLYRGQRLNETADILKLICREFGESHI
ncbi:unnamed protein product, partial [Amoebophrya sp. A25]|eukprot:GSA25T00027484001.1